MTPEQKENNRRKFFVRRCYKKSPLWAVEIIRERYPDYENTMLSSDLKLKYRQKKEYIKKVKTPDDFRSLQLKKYVELLETSEPESKDYHRACIMISRLTEAHNKHKDIFLSICLEKQMVRYGFKWNSNEKYIKAVAAMSAECSTHKEFEEKLDQLYKQMHSFGR